MKKVFNYVVLSRGKLRLGALLEEEERGRNGIFVWLPGHAPSLFLQALSCAGEEEEEEAGEGRGALKAPVRISRREPWIKSGGGTPCWDGFAFLFWRSVLLLLLLLMLLLLLPFCVLLLLLLLLFCCCCCFGCCCCCCCCCCSYLQPLPLPDPPAPPVALWQTEPPAGPPVPPGAVGGRGPTSPSPSSSVSVVAHGHCAGLAPAAVPARLRGLVYKENILVKGQVSRG